MSMKLSLDDLLKLVKEQKSFEVKGFEDDKAIVEEYKGVVKIKDEKLLKQARRFSPRTKLKEEQLETLGEVVKKLFEMKMPFKLVFERSSVMIRLGEKYIRVYKGEVRAVAFESEEEEPLRTLRPTLSKLGKIKLYKPLK